MVAPDNNEKKIVILQNVLLNVLAAKINELGFERQRRSRCQTDEARQPKYKWRPNMMLKVDTKRGYQKLILKVDASSEYQK